MHLKILLFVRALRRFCEKSVHNFSSYDNLNLIVETATARESRLQRRLQTHGLVNALIPTFASQAVETRHASPEKGTGRTTAWTSSVFFHPFACERKPFLSVPRGRRCRGRPPRRPSFALSLPGARCAPASPREAGALRGTDRSGPRTRRGGPSARAPLRPPGLARPSRGPA